jgi:hypothetical protein
MSATMAHLNIIYRVNQVENDFKADIAQNVIFD